ncbi:choice-of-anchor D domain-containing protein [Nonlabens sp. SCSIO 43208]|uniref:LamG-like jellyroll fold domain-containing protein n=1 Tax=Nonlabens sp. SCSIO 43208 TaxID=2793009 RepID=UPI003D6A3DE8
MKNITPTIKMNWLTLIIIFIGFYSISQTSQVDVEINWPQWSGENYVIIYDNAGNEIIRICNPTNCYNGSSVAYSTTIDLGCLPNGTYRARLWDRYNDGWNGSGYIRITSGGSVVFDQNLPGGASGSSYNFTVSGGGGTCGSTTQEINIQGLGNDIVNNDTTPSLTDGTDFGTVVDNGTITRTFTVQNLGVVDLNLGANSVSLSGVNAADFSIDNQPNAIIPGNSSSTFDVSFSRATYGISNATLTITNDDADENPYVFNITGESVAAENTLYYENFDNGPAGWSSNTGGTVWTLGNEGDTGEKGEGDYWYTDNFNNYPSNANARITSPIISTIGWVDMNFKIDFRTNTNDNDDGMRVEYSANGGTTWNVLGSVGSGENWYNETDVDGFANGADAWALDNSVLDPSLSRFEEATHSLPAVLNNNPTVRFRIVFRSDGDNTRDDGVLFDNIIITGTPLTPMVAPDGPADVDDNLSLWLRSQDIPATDGDLLTVWEDQALDNDAFENPSDAPNFANNPVENINFNPTVSFDRSAKQHMRGKGGFNSDEYWIVVRSSLDMSGSISNETMLLGAKAAPINPAKDPSGLGWGPTSARYNNEVLAHNVSTVSENDANEYSYGRAYSNPTRTFDDVHIINVKNNPSDSGTEIYINGRKVDNVTGTTTVSGQTLNFKEFENKPFYLAAGRYEMNGLPFDTHLDGQITEVFSYRNRLSSAVQQRIYSYLAIKNGVSLKNPSSTSDDHQADWDYLNSDDAVIWDYASNSGYNWDVAGIGRDDKSELTQKQSKSENSTSIVAIGLNNVEDIGTDNSQNFNNDQDFLIWGHNGQDTNLRSGDISHDLGITDAVNTRVQRMNRVWKINEVATDIPVTGIRVATSDLSGLPALTTDMEYVLLVADDPNFTTNFETRFFWEDGAYQRTQYDFDGTKYFSIGVSYVEFEDRSVVFDGVDDHIIIDNGTGLGSTFSASAWVLSAGSNDLGNHRTIVAKREGTSGFQLSLRPDNRIRVVWYNPSQQRIVSNTAINDNAWQHIAVTYDGSDVSIYIDGILDNTAAVTTPVADSNVLAIGARVHEDGSTYDHWAGEVDEIRMWDIALSQNQIRYIMNQELENNTDLVAGTVIPFTVTKNEINTVDWSELKAYYSMNSFIGTALNDQSTNRGYGRMANENYYDLRVQTAPLPYKSNTNGEWENNSTWENGSLLFTPGSTRVVNGIVHKVDWNIVETTHDVEILNTDATLLGLFVLNNQLDVENDHGLTVTHHLEIDGTIDLKGESQLIQTVDSDLEPTSTGNLERDQQGTNVQFDYNYWSSPVSSINNTTINHGYTIAGELKDGTIVENPRDLNFTARSVRDGAPGDATTAATISGRWLYKYNNLAQNTYSAWQYVGPNGSMQAGEGFTMKGTGASTSDQNYVFVGKPNNGDITLPINAGNDYLVGNPYPSALDAHEFIEDNPNLDGTLYFWEHWGGNSHVLQQYQGGYAMYNYSGGVPNATLGTSNPLVNSGGTPTKRPERFVPVAQGFFVRGVSNGTIRFENDQRQFVKENSGNSIFVAAPGSGAVAQGNNEYNTDSDTRMKFRIGFDGAGGIHRQILLAIDPASTSGFDRAFDGIQQDTQFEDMSFDLNGDKLSIQGIPSIDNGVELPLNIKLSSTDSFVIGLDAIENVPTSQVIYVKDAVLGTYTNLMNGDYTSPVLNAGNQNGRFSIVFNDPSTLSNDTAAVSNDMVVYQPQENQTLNIQTSNGLLVEQLSLVNMLGQVVVSVQNDENNELTTLNTDSYAAGTYILNMNTNRGNHTEKVIIK